jgi:hypothetical protein
MNRLLAPALGALALWTSLPAAALAGEGECLFKRTPAAKRDAIYAKYYSNDLIAQIEVFVPMIEGLAEAAKACNVEKTPEGFTDEDWGRALGAVWAGYMMDDLGARRLETRYRVPRSRLDAVWAELSPVRRRALADYMQKLGLKRPLEDGEHKQFADLILAVDPDYDLKRLFLGLDPQGAIVPDMESKGYAIITHFMGRAMRTTDMAAPARPDADPGVLPRPSVHAGAR